jgi:hypothetical protein
MPYFAESAFWRVPGALGGCGPHPHMHAMHTWCRGRGRHPCRCICRAGAANIHNRLERCTSCAAMMRARAGVGPGDGATCVSLSPGGGLSLRCRQCQTPGYRPLKGATALEITLRPNSNSTDPFFSSTPQDQVGGCAGLFTIARGGAFLHVKRQWHCRRHAHSPSHPMPVLHCCPLLLLTAGHTGTAAQGVPAE